jgi:hypothetical protein
MAAHGEGWSFYSHQRQLTNGNVKLWAARAAERRRNRGWQSGSGRDRHNGAVVRTVWLTGGSTWFYIFATYLNWLKFGN